MSFSSTQYREALGRFATGVAIVTCRGNGSGPVGMTVNSFTSLSLDPPLILWCLDKSSDRAAVFETCDTFAVNVLTRGQQALSVKFSESGQHDFTGFIYETGTNGSPIFADSLAVLECTAEACHHGGDHLIIVARVQEMSAHDGEPLLYYQRAYRDIGSDG